MAKVLVVDDEPAFADFAKLLLDGMGHATRVCLEASRAVEAADAFKPDIIITDLQMPDMDGLQLIQALKSRPETKSVPVILASSNTEKSLRMEAQKLGALYSIVKPLQAKPLKLLLDQILSSRKTET